MTFDRSRRDHEQTRPSVEAVEPAVGKMSGLGASEVFAGEAAHGNPASAGAQNREAGKGEAAGKGEPGKGGAKPDAGSAAGAPPAGARPGALGKITVTGKSKAAGEPISKVAVGEKVTMLAPGGEIGAWTVDGADVGTGNELKWTAPETPGGRVVRFEADLSGPNTGKSTSTIVLVAAPTEVDFKKMGDVPSAGVGMAGVGMFLQVTVNPVDVSFEDVEWLERPGPAEEPSGYFAAYVASGQSLFHVANTTWLPMGADNKGVVDRAYSRDKPKLKKPDEGADKPNRWWTGAFQWSIPNVYRVKGGSGEHLFANVTQKFTMDDQGTMTVTKGAASATAKPGGDVQGDLEKFTNITEAKTYLSRFGRAGAIQAAMDYKRVPKADPASVGLLTQALIEFDILFRVELTCSNTFSVTDPDVVTVTANGIKSDGGPKKINDKEGKKAEGKMGENVGSFEFHLSQVLDLRGLVAAPINLEANMESLISHKTSLTIAFPYTKSEGSLHGNRYTYEAKIK